MHYQICSENFHKLSRPVAQTAVPPKWHLENYLIYLQAGFVHREAIDSGGMKLQVESFKVFLKSITHNVMPCWARVWKYNNDPFEC